MKPQKHRKFVLAVATAALVFAGIGAAPARADEDVLRALAAIAGIAIVGKVIRDNVQERRAKGPLTRRQLAPAPVKRRATGPVYDTSPLSGLAVRPLPERVRKTNRRQLPGDCLRSEQTWDGQVRYFGQRCLERQYSYSNQLPRACAISVRGRNGLRRGYEARCLRRQGFQLARN
ncbi:MAG: hypothetical protein AAF636_01285 [Pseudomonadota bacterium]